MRPCCVYVLRKTAVALCTDDITAGIQSLFQSAKVDDASSFATAFDKVEVAAVQLADLFEQVSKPASLEPWRLLCLGCLGSASVFTNVWS